MKMKFHNLCFLILYFCLASCQNEQNPCHLSETVLMDINEIDSLLSIPKNRNRLRKWDLQNFKDSSIFDAENETYKFMLSSSTFGTELYRIEKKENAYNAIIKIFAYRDTIGTFKQFKITKEVWNSITEGLNENHFWIYPSSDNRKVLDGSTWILEGFKPTKDKCTLKNYHRIGRASPIDKQFIAMCMLFYNLKQK